MDNSSLWTEYKSSPTPALKKMIVVNYSKLVHYVIHHSKFASHNLLDERDYFQFGVEGLSQAIDRFDPNFGTKFETYAIKRIRGKIIDELRKLQMKNSFGDGVVYSSVSIDTPLDDEENFCLLDILPSDYDNPDIELEKNEAIELLGKAIKELPDRDRTILGLYYYEHLNYQEISQVLNITVSRISQIHSKIIKTLKTKLMYINA